MARAYRAISSDSHLEIGPDRWRDRVPEQYRDRAPRVIKLPNGGDAVQAEGQPLRPLWAHNAGIPWEEWGFDNFKTFAGSPGAGTAQERLKELDLDGIDAEVLYPGVSGLALLSGISDNEAYWAVVRAYNEFIADEYMGTDPERFFPVGVIPKRGVDAAIAELEYCKRLGLKAIALDAYPNGSVTPKAEDDRFWAAALDIDMPVTVHTSFSAIREGRERAGELNLARRISTYGTKAGIIAATMAIHGLFTRFPTLQVFFAENQVGWIPNYLEQADLIWERHRFYHERAQGLEPLDRPPSEIIKEHCLWGFMDNPVGVRLRHEIGVDKILWSTDFPHDPSDWPNTRQTIERNFAGVPDEEKYQMMAGNAIRFFKLDAPPATSQGSEPRVAQAV